MLWFSRECRAGIIDPTKVLRCCLENASSVARTFIMSDAVVSELPGEGDDQGAGSGAGMDFGAM